MHDRPARSLQLIERVERYAPLNLTEASFKASILITLLMPSEAASVLRHSEPLSLRSAEDETYVRRYREYMWAIIRGDPDSEAHYAAARAIPASYLPRRFLP